MSSSGYLPNQYPYLCAKRHRIIVIAALVNSKRLNYEIAIG